MVVGCLEITLSIVAADSLKEKRSVVKRIVERTRNKFNVSCSEVGANDEHQRAIVGVTTVANDAQFVNSVLDKVLDYVEDEAIGRCEVVDHRIEILHVSGRHEG
jgi:uncharacterized protein YlxP (DUF503 family)